MRNIAGGASGVTDRTIQGIATAPSIPHSEIRNPDVVEAELGRRARRVMAIGAAVTAVAGIDGTALAHGLVRHGFQHDLHPPHSGRP
jgi:hypothetical protein